MMRFKEFYKLSEAWNDYPLNMVIPNPPFGAVPSDFTGSDTPPDTSPITPHTSNFDLALPNVTKTAQILFMDEKKNPILVYLSDGTRLMLSHDERRRIRGDLGVGKTITVNLQRRPDDRSPQTSQIQSITVH